VSSTAIWSAVAASFAALAAFLSFLTQRRNLLESVRPEIVLDGWTRISPGLRFTSIRNVGRGSALHIVIVMTGVAKGEAPPPTSPARMPGIVCWLPVWIQSLSSCRIDAGRPSSHVAWMKRTLSVIRSHPCQCHDRRADEEAERAHQAHATKTRPVIA
jgi:hypothetical protein